MKNILLNRKSIVSAITLSLVLPAVCAFPVNASENFNVNVIEDISTVQAFTDEKVSDEDIQSIITAGINAPSALNGQPWHFSVITDKEILDKLSGSGGTMPAGDFPEGLESDDSDSFGGEASGDSEGESSGESSQNPGASGSMGSKAGLSDAPLVIVVSCKDGSDLDAGLATQNMSAQAQILGYGTKIISSPKMTLNSDGNKELLGVPEGMSVVCVLLVGKTDTEKYDAVTGATTRNPMDEVVTFVK
ncbi:MAG: nitroreductase family protein [Parasporobacterium sp.]|nr:nitroreductase family protein [Parasporobacterium sp.]